VTTDAFTVNASTLSSKDKAKSREIAWTQAHTAVGIRDSRMVCGHVECVFDTRRFGNMDKMIIQTLVTHALSNPG